MAWLKPTQPGAAVGTSSPGLLPSLPESGSDHNPAPLLHPLKEFLHFECLLVSALQRTLNTLGTFPFYRQKLLKATPQVGWWVLTQRHLPSTIPSPLGGLC